MKIDVSEVGSVVCKDSVPVVTSLKSSERGLRLVVVGFYPPSVQVVDTNGMAPVVTRCTSGSFTDVVAVRGEATLYLLLRLDNVVEVHNEAGLQTKLKLPSRPFLWRAVQDSVFFLQALKLTKLDLTLLSHEDKEVGEWTNAYFTEKRLVVFQKDFRVATIELASLETVESVVVAEKSYEAVGLENAKLVEGKTKHKIWLLDDSGVLNKARLKNGKLKTKKVLDLEEWEENSLLFRVKEFLLVKAKNKIFVVHEDALVYTVEHTRQIEWVDVVENTETVLFGDGKSPNVYGCNIQRLGRCCVWGRNNFKTFI